MGKMKVAEIEIQTPRLNLVGRMWSYTCLVDDDLTITRALVG